MGLLTDSEEFRQKNITRNEYDKNDEYETGHPNAISDGDELGKGLNNNDAGSATDIKSRKKSIAKNKYQVGGKEYKAGIVE